jgi:hypothetical protein
MEAKWLVNLDLPSAEVPGELFAGLLGGLDREVGQQQPIEGSLKGGRVWLGGEQCGDGDLCQGAIGARRGLEGDAHDLDLLVDGARPPAVGGGSLEADLGEHGGGIEGRAQRAPIGQQPVGMLHPHQPVGAALGTGGLDEQIVKVAFPVGDVGEAGVGELLGQRVDAGEAIDPTHALFLFERAVGIFLLAEATRLACPAVQIEQPEGDALGGERQGRMQIHPPPGLVVQRAEPGDALLGGVVQLRGVLDAQHPGVGAQALLGAGAMRGEHALGRHLGVIEQAVGGARLAPAPAGGGNAQRRFLPQLLREALRATIEASITQVDRAELRGQGAHGATPSAARNCAASG